MLTRPPDDVVTESKLPEAVLSGAVASLCNSAIGMP